MSRKVRGPLLLAILDGWGLRDEVRGNAIRQAATPVLDSLAAAWPSTSLQASGGAVGLHDGQMGNSNVGHLTMGAGRVIYQDLVRIDRAIASGAFCSNPVLTDCLDATRESGQALHLMGLLSDGGVHSHINHLFALMRLARERGLSRVYVDAILDGRDTPPRSAEPFLREVQARALELGLGGIATVSGRYYAMDRDHRWERTQRAYAALVAGQGLYASDALTALADAYARDEGDEFVQPTVITDAAGRPLAPLQPGDGLVFFNFRADRARQITHALTDPDFSAFSVIPLSLRFAAMTEYEEGLPIPVIFPPQQPRDVVGEVVARAGLRQLRIAETEKYAHVTYFFNGGQERVFPGEERILVPSPKVATYDLQPAMSAPEVTERLLSALATEAFDLIVLNFANADMVGHTGVVVAAVAAVETVDQCVGRLVQAVLAHSGAVLITADHGNAEQMIDPESGGVQTAHTANPVPFIAVVPGERRRQLAPGELADVGPTLLRLLGLDVPETMTGRDLLAAP